MKRLVTAGLLCAALTGARAAELTEHHLSARPIDNVNTTAADRKFMAQAATDIMHQIKAADIAAQFASSKEAVEMADSSRETLQWIYGDLKDLANLKRVALPLEGNIEQPRDLQKVLDSRGAALEREYDRYAERSSLRMLERFYDASRKAEDREVRAFALRHLRPIYGNYQVAKGLNAPSGTMIAKTPAISPGHVAAPSGISTSSTNTPVTAAVSPSPPVP